MVHTKVHHKVSQKSTGRKITGIKKLQEDFFKQFQFQYIGLPDFILPMHCIPGSVFKSKFGHCLVVGYLYGLFFLWDFGIRDYITEKQISSFWKWLMFLDLGESFTKHKKSKT